MMYRGLLVASVLGLSLVTHSVIAPSLAAGAADEGVATLVRGVAALDKGDAADAERLLTEAISAGNLEPDSLASALVNRGLARQRQGKLKAAIVDYSAALKLDALTAHQRAVALYNRGLAARKMGQFAQAVEDFTSAIYLDPYFARAYFSRGNILYRAGQNLFALADYEKALAYGHPRPHVVRYAIALVDLALDRKEKARDALIAALREKPDFQPARRHLAQLMKTDGVALADLTASSATVAGTKEDGDGVSRLAALAGDRRVNLRRRARPQPVAPVAEKDESPDGIRDRRKRAPDGLMVASLPARPSASRPVERTTTAERGGHGATKVRAVASERTVGQGAPASADTGVAAQNVTVRPVSAPPVEQNVHAAAEARPKAGTVEAAASGDAGKTANATETLAEERRQWRGWAIQLSSQPTEAAAWSHWKKLEKRVRRVIRKVSPVVMKAEIAGRGTYYRLRLVGFDDRRLPRRLCKRLKRRGTSCFVTRAGS